MVGNASGTTRYDSNSQMRQVRVSFRNAGQERKPTVMSEMREEVEPCDCLNWCRNGMPPNTRHHPRCSLYNLEQESVVLVNDLIKGIEAWASDEDGVHPELWNAYCSALYFVGNYKALAHAINKSEEL